MEQDTHNLEKFRSQRIEQLKELRHNKFKYLDVEFFKALETNDIEKIKSISEQKELLRNIDKYKFPNFEDARAILDHIPDFLM